MQIEHSAHDQGKEVFQLYMFVRFFVFCRSRLHRADMGFLIVVSKGFNCLYPLAVACLYPLGLASKLMSVEPKFIVSLIAADGGPR